MTAAVGVHIGVIAVKSSAVSPGREYKDIPIALTDWDNRGAELFAALTKANLNKALAIVIDGKVVSAPTIQSTLGKKGIITGRFSERKSCPRPGPPRRHAAGKPTGQRANGNAVGGKADRQGTVRHPC